MRRLGSLLLVLVLMAGGYLAWRWLFPSDEHLIRQVLSTGAQEGSWNAAQSSLSQLAGPARLAALCTIDVEVQLEAPGLAGRSIRGADEVRQLALAARANTPSCQVDLSDLSVALEPDRQAAVVQVVATARIGGSEDPIVQEFRIEMRKVDRRWKIARVEPVRGFGM